LSSLYRVDYPCQSLDVSFQNILVRACTSKDQNVINNSIYNYPIWLYVEISVSRPTPLEGVIPILRRKYLLIQQHEQRGKYFCDILPPPC
jgi:hypothetical protein